MDNKFYNTYVFRVGSSVVFDPFFTTNTTAVKLNNENINSEANDEEFRDEVDTDIKCISTIGNVKHPGKSDYEGNGFIISA